MLSFVINRLRDQEKFSGKEEIMCNSTTYGHECCCVPQHGHGHGMSFRHFKSRSERKELLEQYEAELKKEIAGVEERIKEIENS